MTDTVLDGRFNDAAAAVRYITAPQKGRGKAIVSLRSKRTADRYTYLVEKPADFNCHLVSVLVGSNNESDYQFIGSLGRAGFKHSIKSGLAATATSVIAFEWSYRKLAAGTLPEKLEVWHEGCCGRCGRKLTVPESIASGFGPECIKKAGAE